MLRKCLLVLSAAVILAGSLLGEEIRGKITSVDINKNTITVAVGDKEQTLPVNKDAKVYVIGKGKGGAGLDVPGGIQGLTVGSDVTVTTDKKDSGGNVTDIKVTPAPTKKKN